MTDPVDHASSGPVPTSNSVPPFPELTATPAHLSAPALHERMDKINARLYALEGLAAQVELPTIRTKHLGLDKKLAAEATERVALEGRLHGRIDKVGVRVNEEHERYLSLCLELATLSAGVREIDAVAKVTEAHVAKAGEAVETLDARTASQGEALARLETLVRDSRLAAETRDKGMEHLFSSLESRAEKTPASLGGDPSDAERALASLLSFRVRAEAARERDRLEARLNIAIQYQEEIQAKLREAEGAFGAVTARLEKVEAEKTPASLEGGATWSDSSRIPVPQALVRRISSIESHIRALDEAAAEKTEEINAALVTGQERRAGIASRVNALEAVVLSEADDSLMSRVAEIESGEGTGSAHNRKLLGSLLNRVVVLEGRVGPPSDGEDPGDLEQRMNDIWTEWQGTNEAVNLLSGRLGAVEGVAHGARALSRGLQTAVHSLEDLLPGEPEEGPCTNPEPCEDHPRVIIDTDRHPSTPVEAAEEPRGTGNARSHAIEAAERLGALRASAIDRFQKEAGEHLRAATDTEFALNRAILNAKADAFAVAGSMLIDPESYGLAGTDVGDKADSDDVSGGDNPSETGPSEGDKADDTVEFWYTCRHGRADHACPECSSWNRAPKDPPAKLGEGKSSRGIGSTDGHGE